MTQETVNYSDAPRTTLIDRSRCSQAIPCRPSQPARCIVAGYGEFVCSSGGVNSRILRVTISTDEDALDTVAE